MQLSAGAKLGPYQIVGLVGRGGVAEVYRGRDTRLNRPVAIKILLDDVADVTAVIPITRTGVRAMSTAYRFLPDGKSLVVQQGEWRKPQFWLVNLETDARRQLTDLRPGRSTRSFDVTPDGKRIVFDRVQENSDIVLIELAR